MSNGMKLILLIAELVTVGSALIVAINPNILYSAVFLLFAFLGVAVMYLFAGADFLAGVQIVVYVGGVTILILFAIMLTQWLYRLKLKDIGSKFVIPGVVLALGLVPFLHRGLTELGKMIQAAPPEKMAEFAASPKTQAIGKALLGTHVLPFEAITILLLGALVGAVWLARPRT
ncbi:NADH-quinone oxidoreductase subunit J [bacterium]|nr:NADH-quinone oxidoreductase subunit J [bacterium]